MVTIIFYSITALKRLKKTQTALTCEHIFSVKALELHVLLEIMFSLWALWMHCKPQVKSFSTQWIQNVKLLYDLQMGYANVRLIYDLERKCSMHSALVIYKCMCSNRCFFCIHLDFGLCHSHAFASHITLYLIKDIMDAVPSL